MAIGITRTKLYSGYFGVQSWEKDHHAQNKLAILMIGSFLKKVNAD